MEDRAETNIVTPPAAVNMPPWRRDLMLFWCFFRIAALVLGGGYAIIAAIQQEFVTRRHLLTDDDILEMITITQTVPGIIACNSAVYVGLRLGGKRGAAAALFGSILPSMTIIMLVAAGLSMVEDGLRSSIMRGVFKGVISGIVGMVTATALKMRKKAIRDIFGIVVAAAVFIAISVFKVIPPLVIAVVVAAGLLKVWLERRKERQRKEQ